MGKVLVSIVSQQTIPNILFIKEIVGVDKFLFIYTKEVAKELQYILTTIQIAHPIMLEVAAFDILAINQQLIALSFSPKDEYVVNITGGTKLMSLAVYQHFVRFRDCKVYYMPIGKNTYQQIYPAVAPPKEISYRIGVTTYLNAYGTNVKSNDFPIRKFNYTRQFALANFKKEKLPEEEKGIINCLGERLGKKKRAIGINEVKGVAAYLKSCQFKPIHAGFLQEKEIAYLRGGWLEEYLYFLFKKQLVLNNHQIILNAIVPFGTASNEFDILFTLNNRLHIIECKTGRRIRTEDYNNIVYKSGTIKGSFGINTKSYIFSLSHRMGDDIDKDTRIVDRAKQGQILYLGRDIFDKETHLIKFIKNIR